MVGFLFLFFFLECIFLSISFFFFFQAEDGIRDLYVTGVQTCALPIYGFRFDLASILTRDASGEPMPNPPVLWDIESDPVLAGTKLFAEAWDAAGLYQVGSFVGDSWKEWNGRFRDDVRDFFRGAHGSLRRFADRLVGSPEIYGHKQREPEQSVNFDTCHDGFTLNDLVSYDRKHNEANGEQNRDGADDNRSWNCGVEGPTSRTGGTIRTASRSPWRCDGRGCWSTSS